MTDTLTDAVLRGSRRALARLLTHIENEEDGAHDMLAALYPHTGRAWIIGVTGAPGTGKSTLVSTLAARLRTQGRTVGILAIDPTSPFTGGAILGDRIRMRDLAGDPGVFIRSMATRGSLGGLARAARDAARALDAAGFDVVLIETVGAGQNEVDIVRAAYTTIVVEAPGLGDEVQAIKAGILEIADILVLNKADRPGAAGTLRALRTMLEIGHPTRTSGAVGHHGAGAMRLSPPPPDAIAGMWVPPIVETVASEGRGIETLIERIEAHRAFLETDERRAALERAQIDLELRERLRDVLLARLLAHVPAETIAMLAGQVQARAIDPAHAVEHLLNTSHPEPR
jgi:LAO/AO transport system kinase